MHEQGQLPRDEVMELIEGQPALWVRLAATREGGAWLQSLLEIVGGEAPPGWVERTWEYDNIVFVSAVSDGKEVAAWLRQEEARLSGYRVKLPPAADSIQWEAKASKSSSAFELLPWPHRTFSLGWNPLKEPPGSGSLVAPDAPSFVQYVYAAGSFFGLPGALGGTGGQSQVLRLQERSGRVSSVRVGATEVEVTVEGEQLPGSVVELASERPGSSITLGKEGLDVVRFPLPEGLPRGAWIVLKRGSQWFDRKFLSWPNAADPGVEQVVEDRDRLSALIAAGEGPNIEFKRELSKDRGTGTSSGPLLHSPTVGAVSSCSGLPTTVR